MQIRNMVIDDYEAVFKLWTNTSGMGMRSLDDSKEGIGRFLRRNPATNFVAVEDGVIIGVTLGGHDGRRGYIYHTAVDSGYRGRGIGRKLVESVIAAFENEGINKAALVVFKTNDTGIKFWHSLGWEQRQDLNYYNKSMNNNNQ